MKMSDELRIIKCYGPKKQAKQFAEESYELTEAINDFENQKIFIKEGIGKEFLKTHIIEEIADVTLMIRQFKEYYEIDDDRIEKFIEQKKNRQLKRIMRV